jgi:hypothetical protein
VLGFMEKAGGCFLKKEDTASLASGLEPSQ